MSQSPFNFPKGIFWTTENLNFDQVQSTDIFYYAYYVCIFSKKSLPPSEMQKYFPIFSSRGFIILAIAFRFMIHPKLIFVRL